jgi:hypothetical protein
MGMGLRTFSTHLDLHHHVRCAVVVASASRAAGAGEIEVGGEG